MRKYTRCVCFTLFLLLALSWPATSLLAHGGGLLRVASEPAGPYQLSVWTSPTRLEADHPGHITVGVADASDAPVLGAEVLVQLQSVPGGKTILSTPATTAQSTNKLFYEADMILPEIGLYTMLVQVNGSEGTGQVTFPVEVQAASQTNWFLLGFILLGLLVSFFLFRLWEKQPADPAPRPK